MNFTLQQPVANPVASVLRRAYFAATSFMDAEIGRVLRTLDSTNTAGNTVLPLLIWAFGWRI